MVDVDQSLQRRAFLETWGTVIIAGLIVAAVLLGWWAYQINMVPTIEEDEVLVEEWSESTEYNHSAEIIQDSIPFELGEIVENRPLYYVNLSNELHGTYTYQYTADEGIVDVSTETMLLVRAGELRDQEMVEIYWEVARPLESGDTTDLRPDESHEVGYDVDIMAVLELISTVENQVGAREGLVDVRVRSVTEIDGEVQGDTVSVTHQSDKIMVVNPQTFRVIDTTGVDERHQEFRTVETVVEPNPLEAYGSILLFALAMVLAAVMVVAQQSGYIDLSEEERMLLTIERDLERFSEWISTGTFPSEREYEQTILVDDLEGLVDIAIDTNKRVIEDQQLGVSTVLDGDYVYLFVRPDSPARDWLVEYADTTIGEFESSAG